MKYEVYAELARAVHHGRAAGLRAEAREVAERRARRRVALHRPAGRLRVVHAGGGEDEAADRAGGEQRLREAGEGEVAEVVDADGLLEAVARPSRRSSGPPRARRPQPADHR